MNFMFGIICGEQIFGAINAGCGFAIICSEALDLCVKNTSSLSVSLGDRNQSPGNNSRGCWDKVII